MSHYCTFFPRQFQRLLTRTWRANRGPTEGLTSPKTSYDVTTKPDAASRWRRTTVVAELFRPVDRQTVRASIPGALWEGYATFLQYLLRDSQKDLRSGQEDDAPTVLSPHFLATHDITDAIGENSYSLRNRSKQED